VTTWLIEPRAATLTIHGCPTGADGGPVIGLHADDGWPVFWCGLGSAVAVAAEENRTAVLAVGGPADAAEPVTVLLAGRLEMIGRGWERGRQVGAVALAPEQVPIDWLDSAGAHTMTVSFPHPAGTAAGRGPGWWHGCPGAG
jgi:hypothetical protein